ncbi:hypothetical protein OG840_36020 [Streptomyces sp. NBC_01764]|uniref:hypothetical protein n=1 Tax=Streptomyces sp. NBC_01764 TaxID=2975935 RepID=UPI0022506BBC|nr:hypothetical protein [Streptomyces sp. NBC_01764]MCX4406856.1 hypothetical protein [Streptomyces sp. NBC_01764]
MHSLPLPLALTARLLPVAVLACTGWVMSSNPSTTTPAATAPKSPQKTQEATSGPSATAVARKYTVAPAPCTGVTVKTVKALVPGAKTAGQEIPSTDKSVRRTCSWNALKGFDYHWLDVSYEIKDSAEAAQKSYTGRVADKGGGGVVPGLGDSAYSVVNLTTTDKQQTREGVVIVRASNALVVVTYNGSDFETKKAPSTDEINKGAIKAAKDVVATLENGQKG